MQHPSSSTLHEVIERQAAATPDAPAVFDACGSLSYAELCMRAERLAVRLRGAGARPNMFIGLCSDRSSDMIVGMLGILKSGAAYVPLDPAYPADRLAFMLEDSAAHLLVAKRSVIAGLPKIMAEVFYLDDASDHDDAAETLVPDDAGETPVLTASGPNDLAYAIYTSGSTGRPKGVMIEHRSIVAFTKWTREYFSAAQTARVLCANSLSFDVSVFEIFAALSSGGAVVIVRNILDLLISAPPEPVSMLLAAPSSLAEIVRAQKIPRSVHTVITGGERLSRQLARDIYQSSAVELVLNTWGVTEDTICTTVFQVPRDPDQDPPIGHAVGDRTVYVLDEQGQPLPAGRTGEMYCAGGGVARGYINRDELNTERFLPNPFGGSEKMYRTGDLALLGEDGEIRFIGRDDQQVKVQGVRIELGEIESELQHCPGVAQAAVVLRAGGNVLDLYAVETSPAILDLSELRRFLAPRLPAHMLPDTLTVCEALPVTPSGKLDRQALQRRGVTRALAGQAYIAAGNLYEEQIAALYGELLGLTDVGVCDNFFALGGKSLLAARLGTEIIARFPVETAALFERYGKDALQSAFAFEPTVRYLAAVLLGLETPPRGKRDLMCIQAGDPGRAPLFIFHGVITGEAFYSFDLMHKLGKDQPLYTIAPHGLDGVAVPGSIEEMAADYLARIRHIQARGPYHFIGYCNGGLVAYEAARMLRAQGEAVDTLVLIASPGHNIRFRRLKKGFDALRFVPGFNEHRRRRLFLNSRERLRLLKYQLHYAAGRVVSTVKGETTDGTKPIERYRKARRLGNQVQREDPRFMQIIKAIDEYVPGTYDGRVCLIWGSQDEYLRTYNPRQDWAAAIGDLHYHEVDGGHTFIDTHPEVILDHFPHP